MNMYADLKRALNATIVSPLTKEIKNEKH